MVEDVQIKEMRDIIARQGRMIEALEGAIKNYQHLLAVLCVIEEVQDPPGEIVLRMSVRDWDKGKTWDQAAREHFGFVMGNETLDERLRQVMP